MELGQGDGPAVPHSAAAADRARRPCRGTNHYGNPQHRRRHRCDRIIRCREPTGDHHDDALFDNGNGNRNSNIDDDRRDNDKRRRIVVDWVARDIDIGRRRSVTERGARNSIQSSAGLADVPGVRGFGDGTVSYRHRSLLRALNQHYVTDAD
jgi:hypothetical protein